MQKYLSKLAILGLILVPVLSAAPAHAQATRTWVSGVGDDVNPCSRTAPCKTFAGAISKTAPNGEINCLDPGGYGSVNITKSMTIDCGPYTHGSILAANVNGVIVNGAGIVVTLRGLSINGAGTTTGNGVRIIQAGKVNIDNVVLENFGGNTANGRGVSIETSTADVRVNIQNSKFNNINFIGVHSVPTAGLVRLGITNSSFTNGNSTAIQVVRLTTGMLDNVRATQNLGAGLTMEASTANMSVSNSILSNNAFGIFSGVGGGAPTTRLYDSTVTFNTTAGLNIVSGTIISSGNNIIRGNAGNEAPSSNDGTQ